MVHGGSTPFDPAELAAVAVQDQAALIVVSAAPAPARALALLAKCPVVVVPGGGPTPRPLCEGPIVFAVDPTQAVGGVAWQATRFALQLGATLRLVHTGPGTPAEDVPAISKALGATLLVVAADGHGAMPELVLEAAEVPVMLIPVGSTASATDRSNEHP